MAHEANASISIEHEGTHTNGDSGPADALPHLVDPIQQPTQRSLPCQAVYLGGKVDVVGGDSAGVVCD